MKARSKLPGWNTLGLLPAQTIMFHTLVIPIGIVVLVSFSTRGPYGGFEYVFSTQATGSSSSTRAGSAGSSSTRNT